MIVIEELVVEDVKLPVNVRFAWSFAMTSRAGSKVLTMVFGNEPVSVPVAFVDAVKSVKPKSYSGIRNINEEYDPQSPLLVYRVTVWPLTLRRKISQPRPTA